MFTLLQGFVDIFSGFGIIVALFTLRFLVGLAGVAVIPRQQPDRRRLVPGAGEGDSGIDF
ncbi:D-glucarate permease [Klebsiella pneumoniae]|uniref:D-glucarate permease n=1 Tax=Klebsiella pneumoniae TaxID=573 RepID=A0A378FRH7_KLEPN|nr:D-glucarate permease [Klebsiella pneumoniae]